MRPILLALFLAAFCGCAYAQSDDTPTMSMDGSDYSSSPTEAASLSTLRLDPSRFNNQTLRFSPVWFDRKIYSLGQTRYVQPRTSPDADETDPSRSETGFVVTDKMAADLLVAMRGEWPHGAEMTCQVKKVVRGGETVWYAAVTHVGILGADGAVARSIDGAPVHVEGDKAASADPVAVTLEATGQAGRLVGIRFTNATGGEETSLNATLPWSKTMFLKPGASVSLVVVDPENYDDMTLKIKSGGAVLKQSTSGHSVSVYATVPSSE